MPRRNPDRAPDDSEDIPRQPAEDLVDRSEEVPEVAYEEGEEEVQPDDIEQGDDLDPQLTD